MEIKKAQTGDGDILKGTLNFDVKLRMGLGDNISIGKGKIDLLKFIAECGSILGAAKEMGMSYRHAWGKIKGMEKDLGASLVRSTRGGRCGGETTLTPFALKLLKAFDDKMLELGELLRFGRKPSLTVDGIVFRGDSFLAVRRKNEPFKGMLALPGGFVDYGERVEEAVIREIVEETSLETKIIELVGVYSHPDRDPRGHTISCVFLLKEVGGEAKAGDDAAEIEWLHCKDPGDLAFDHHEIIRDALASRCSNCEK